ncbi:MAG: type 4a pilus biogenesis protein PilO [Planctomycetes bacterium]|nr:type 4a pilus biogenesis protein PilO [Planctomycetota bacterium]
MNITLTGHRTVRSQWITVVVALVMVASFVAVFYIPNARKLGAAETSLKEAEADLQEKLMRSKDLPVLRDEVRAMEVGYQRDLARIPAEPRTPEFLEAVTAIMKEADIGQREVLPQAPRVRTEYVEQPISISFEAPFDAAHEVLTRIETMDRITRVESLEMVSTPEAEGDVRVKLSVVVFYNNKGQDAGSAAPTQLAVGSGGRG